MKAVRIGCAIFCAALCAALVAHVLIDIAGDYLLVRDTYDGLAHASRGLVAGGAFALLAACAAFALADAVRAARGSEIAFRAVLRSAVPASPAAFAAAVAAATLALVLVMERLDLAFAGRAADDARELAGGSFVLAAGCAIVSALVCATGAWFGLRRLARASAALARVVVAFVRRSVSSAACAPRSRRRRRLVACRNVRLGGNLAGRAPPAPSSHAPRRTQGPAARGRFRGVPCSFPAAERDARSQPLPAVRP